MELERESHSVYDISYHIVFCTKYRHDVLVGAAEKVCRNVIAQTCVAYDWKLHEIEVMPDHVHLLVSASPNTAPSDIAKTVKSISAVTLFREFPKMKKNKFWGSGLWSPSTFYGSVGGTTKETVKGYIENQKKR